MSDLPPESQWLKELSNGVRTVGTGVILLGAFTPFAVAFADPTTARAFDATLALLSLCLGGLLFLAAQDLFLRAYR